MVLVLTTPLQSALSSRVEVSHRLKSVFPVSCRSEWIYRTPKSLSGGSILNSSPRPSVWQYPSSLSCSRSNASLRTAETLVTGDPDYTKSFFSSVPRTDLNPPLLRPIPSESQLTFEPELTPNATTHKGMSRPFYISTPAALDTNSLSPASSRSDSPVTPVSLSSICRTGRRRSYDLPRHHHRRCTHSVEIAPTSTTQSSPSKSILTRTASVSTRASSHTANKSVKFATIPTVHYATHAYWDADVPDTNSIEINIDSMDVDHDPFANYRSREGFVLEADQKSLLTQPRPTTPTSKRNPKYIKHFIHLARNSVRSRYLNKVVSERPVISSPYALGSYPSGGYHVVGTESSSSLASQRWSSSLSFRRNGEAAGSSSSVGLAVKHGLSCSRTSGTVSLRSVESTSSRTERFRIWLGRTVGWAPT